MLPKSHHQQTVYFKRKAVLIIFLNSNAKLQESLGKEKDCACCENNYNKEIRV